ncbi:amino acid/polyamine transporter I, partial [Syncephalis plumigaleata]
MTSVKLVIMLLFAITGIVLLVSNNASNISNPGNWHAMFSGTSTSVNNYTTAMFNVFWAYGGWSGINSCAGELRNPRRTLPIASFGGLTVVMILYLLVNAAYITIVPAKLAFESREILAGTFSSIVFGLYFGRVILPLLIAINTYGQLVGHIFTSSRIIQMAAKEGYLPLARLFSRVNPTTNTPIYALALNWTLFVLVLFVTPLGNAFSFLLNMTGYPNSLFTLFTVMCVLILRRIEPERERPFRVWWIVPVIFITGFFHPICAVSLLFY